MESAVATSLPVWGRLGLKSGELCTAPAAVLKPQRCPLWINVTTFK
jgi:hypothetical protein